jgi:hypothetical protein
MTRILLDTQDLMGTARDFTSITGQLGGVLARLPGDALTVMPPGVAAEVASAVADATAGVGGAAARLAGHALDLDRRAIFAEISEGGGGLSGGIGGLGRVLSSGGASRAFGRGGPLGGFDWSLAGGPISRVIPPSAFRMLESGLDHADDVLGVGAFFGRHLNVLKLSQGATG